jgi:hypothetical protein
MRPAINSMLENVRTKLEETTAAEGIDAFNTKLAKLLQRLKKDAEAKTIKQNYKGTGSQKFRRQLWVRFNSGAVIDLWLEKEALGLGGVVTNGVGNPLTKKAILYQGKTPEQVYAEVMPVLKAWATKEAA